MYVFGDKLSAEDKLIRYRHNNCIFNYSKNVVSGEFKTELMRLQGAEPIWKVFFLNPPEEIKDVIKIGTIRQQLERELHSITAMSCILTVDNSKNQWNPRKFKQKITETTISPQTTSHKIKLYPSFTNSVTKDWNCLDFYSNPATFEPWIENILVTVEGTTFLGTSYQGKMLVIKDAQYVVPFTGVEPSAPYRYCWAEANGKYYLAVDKYIGELSEPYKNEFLLKYTYPYTDMTIYDFAFCDDDNRFYLAYRYKHTDGRYYYNVDIFNSEFSLLKTITLEMTLDTTHLESALAVLNGYCYWALKCSVYRIEKNLSGAWHLVSFPTIWFKADQMYAHNNKLFIISRIANGNILWIYNLNDGISTKYTLAGYVATMCLHKLTNSLYVFIRNPSWQRYIHIYKTNQDDPQYDEILGAEYLKIDEDMSVRPNGKTVATYYFRSVVYHPRGQFLAIEHGSRSSTECKDWYIPAKCQSIHTDFLYLPEILFGYAELGYFRYRTVFEEPVRIWKGFKRRDGIEEYIPSFTGIIDEINTMIGPKAEIRLIDYNRRLQQYTAEKVTINQSDGTLSVKLNMSEDIGNGRRGLKKSTTEINVVGDLSLWKNSGYIKINEEVIKYNSYTIQEQNRGTFHNCERGVELTTATTHDDGETVFNHVWYTAPKTSTIVKKLLDEAKITEYEVEDIMIQSKISQFSYNGMTPDVPPFGKARAIVYDSIRNHFWIGVDNRLYQWKKGIWNYISSFTNSVSLNPNYITHLAVEEKSGNVVIFCTDSQYDSLIKFSSGIPFPYIFCRDAVDSYLYDYKNKTISNLRLSHAYAVRVHTGVKSVQYAYWWRGIDTRKRIYIIDNKLFYIFGSWSGTTKVTNGGIAVCSLVPPYTIQRIVNYGVENDDAYGVFCDSIELCEYQNKLYTFGCRVRDTEGYTFFLYEIDPKTLSTTLLASTSPTWTPKHDATYTCAQIHERNGIKYILTNKTEFNLDADSTENKLLMMPFDDLNNEIIIKKYLKSFNEHVDDTTSALIRLTDTKYYYFTGTAYVKGAFSKLYILEDVNENFQIIDIGIPVKSDKGLVSNLCYDLKNDVLYGVTAPSCTFWQYGKQALLSTFNQSDLKANFGTETIYALLKNIAIASGAFSYFDELGIYHFKKRNINIQQPTVLFVEDDITQIKEENGNLAQYPIMNKVIVQLFDGSYEKYELPDNHSSKKKYGIETKVITNPWMNTPEIAYQLAKNMVEMYALPKPLLQGKLRWFPILQVYQSLILQYDKFGCIVSPSQQKTTLFPTNIQADHWFIFEVVEESIPPVTTVKIRKI
jgi:hypothetical protein